MKKIFVFLALLTAVYAKSYSQQVNPNVSAQPKSVAPGKPIIGLEVGNIAPDLKFKSPEGKEIALSSLRGNIVLIDFWASWCMPCRMENPNVVTAYKKYKTMKFKNNAKGFTVYSVSLDRDKDNWMKAIAQDNLEWKNHVSDLLFWQSQAAAIYGVQSIPTNWLINEKGIIVAKSLRGPYLDQELDKLVIETPAKSSKAAEAK